MTSSFIRSFAGVATAVTLLAAPSLSAQTGVGAHLTPFAGYLITGNWYDGPIGTSIATTNAPMLGVQGAIPLTRGVALVGSLGYASGDLRIGLPLLGGVNVGSAKTWMYDAALELGGLSDRSKGIAPFVTGGIGGMTNDIKASVFETRASNVAFTAGVGVDVGVSDGLALRFQAKDWIGRFNSEDAIGFRAEGNLAHNWALTAGVKLGF
ncbi:outer membrane beta-barrel protein [Gemmatimonas sp.]